MKIINKKVLTLLFALTILVGCEKPFNFDREYYQNVVYILSDKDDFNEYERAVVDLNKDEDVVYVTIGVGGSLAPTKDIQVELVQNYDTLTSLWGKKNKSTKDIKYEEWSKILPAKYYRFDSKYVLRGDTLGVTIPAGKISVQIPVYVKNLSELSPDSTYVLDFKILNASNKNVNKKKNEALIPIFWENNWTSTKVPQSYELYGEQGDVRNPNATKLANERVITSTPTLLPLAKNKVRMPAGIENVSKTNDKTELEMIQENSIVVVINDDNTIDFEQYDKDKGLRVEKVESTSPFADQSYNNTYALESVMSAGNKIYYKTFKLHYRYKKDSKWIYCKTELKKEYNPNID